MNRAILFAIAALLVVGSMAGCGYQTRSVSPEDEKRVDELYAAVEQAAVKEYSGTKEGSIKWEYRGLQINLTAHDFGVIYWSVATPPSFVPSWDRKYDFPRSGEAKWHRTGEWKTRFHTEKVATNYRDAAKEAIYEARIAADEIANEIRRQEGLVKK